MAKGFQENQRQMTNWEKMFIIHIISYYQISCDYYLNIY